MPAPNSAYADALAATIADFSPEFADNITQGNALLKYLSKKGNIRYTTGGTEILENIMYPGSMPGGWYVGPEILDISPTDSLTAANFQLKQAYTNCVFTGQDELVNAGKAKMLDFFAAKKEAVKTNLQNIVGNALYYSNTENNGKSIGGLQHLVSDTGLGTVGNIDSSLASNSWWRNQVYDFSNNGVTASATTIQAAINTAYRAVTGTGETPDLMIAGDTFYGYLDASLAPQQRFESGDTANIGFENLKFKGVTVIFDPMCSATRLYILNTKYLHFRPHKDRNFMVGEKKMSINQDAWVIPVWWAGNLTISNRSKQAVIVL